MRNLKRVLSLTLASVMLLGMMVVGASAKGYTDVEAKHNVEAIEVLQAVGVMLGDADSDGNLTGTLRPDDEVSRAEMAVIMAKLMDLDTEYYISTNPFTDMVGHWAEAYAAACYANGIIAGRTTTTYDPSATVTTVEAAAMLMRALGYFQYASDYADGFEMSTVRQGGRINLFRDVDTKTNDAMTRNDVAQLVLNTLESDMVDAEDNTLHISTGESAGNLNITGGQITYVVRTSSADFAYAIDDANNSGFEGGSTDGRQGSVIQLGEQLYQGDLVRDVNARDDFGAPATRWTYKKAEIGTYADEPDYIYTAEVKGKAIYSDLSLNRDYTTPSTSGFTTGADLVIYYNGDVATGGNYYDGCDAGVAGGAAVKSDPFQLTRNNDIALPGSGNGVLVKAYKTVDSNGNVDVTLCVINTYLAVVDGDYDASDKELDLDILSDTGYKIEDTLSLDDFAILPDLSDGDYVLITVAGSDADKDVISIVPAEGVTGEVTKYTIKSNGDNDTVTLDGASSPYKYSASFYDNTIGANGEAVEYLIGGTATFVLDAYGYIIGLDDAEGTNSYVYIMEFAKDGKFTSTSKWHADAFFTDGTQEDIELDKIADNSGSNIDITDWTETGDTTGAGWYRYTVDNKGVYSVRAVKAANQFGGGGSNINPAGGGNDLKVIESGKTPIYYSTTQFKRGSNSTVFVIYDRTEKDVWAYTGIDYVSTVTARAGEDSGPIVTVVTDDSNVYATYVFVEADSVDIDEGGEASGDIVFLLSNSYKTGRARASDTYYIYDAIVNGRKTTIETNSVNSFRDGVGLYTKVWYDENGRVSRAKRVSDTINDTTFDKNVGLIGLQSAKVTKNTRGTVITFIEDDGNSVGLSLASGCDIYKINGTTVDKRTVSQLVDDYGNGSDRFTGNVWAIYGNNGVIAVFVQETDSSGVIIPADEILIDSSDEDFADALDTINDEATAEDYKLDPEKPIEISGAPDKDGNVKLTATNVKPGNTVTVGYETNPRERADKSVILGPALPNGIATGTIPAEEIGEGNDVTLKSVSITKADDVVELEVTGLTNGEVTDGMTFSVTPDKTKAVADQTITLTITLSKAVPTGKKVTVTFTAPESVALVVDGESTMVDAVEFAAGEIEKKVTFTLSSDVEVAATAAIADVEEEDGPQTGSFSLTPSPASLTEANTDASIVITVAGDTFVEEEVAGAVEITGEVEGLSLNEAEYTDTDKITVKLTGTAKKDGTLEITIGADAFENTDEDKTVEIEVTVTPAETFTLTIDSNTNVEFANDAEFADPIEETTSGLSTIYVRSTQAGGYKVTSEYITEVAVVASGDVDDAESNAVYKAVLTADAADTDFESEEDEDLKTVTVAGGDTVEFSTTADFASPLSAGTYIFDTENGLYVRGATALQKVTLTTPGDGTLSATPEADPTAATDKPVYHLTALDEDVVGASTTDFTAETNWYTVEVSGTQSEYEVDIDDDVFTLEGSLVVVEKAGSTSAFTVTAVINDQPGSASDPAVTVIDGNTTGATIAVELTDAGDTAGSVAVGDGAGEIDLANTGAAGTAVFTVTVSNVTGNVELQLQQ